MHKLKQLDDQGLFNHALDAAKIKWKPTQNHFHTKVDRQNVNKGWEGHTPFGLNVMLLPHVVACRETSCTKDLRHEVSIWHRGALHTSLTP